MAKSLSKPNWAHSVKAARDKFHRSGKSVKAWALENGFSVNLVYEVLKGSRPCIRGQSHRIAVKLGIKDGFIEDGELCCDTATGERLGD